MMFTNPPCNCHTIACLLDWLLCCKVKRICDKHDAYILGDA